LFLVNKQKNTNDFLFSLRVESFFDFLFFFLSFFI